MSNDSTLASYQPPGSMYTELIRLAEYSWKKLMRKVNKWVWRAIVTKNRSRSIFRRNFFLNFKLVLKLVFQMLQSPSIREISFCKSVFRMAFCFVQQLTVLNIGHENALSWHQIGQTFQSQNRGAKLSFSRFKSILAVVQTSAKIPPDSVILWSSWFGHWIQVRKKG